MTDRQPWLNAVRDRPGQFPGERRPAYHVPASCAVPARLTGQPRPTPIPPSPTFLNNVCRSASSTCRTTTARPAVVDRRLSTVHRPSPYAAPPEGRSAYAREPLDRPAPGPGKCRVGHRTGPRDPSPTYMCRHMHLRCRRLGTGADDAGAVPPGELPGSGPATSR